MKTCEQPFGRFPDESSRWSDCFDRQAAVPDVSTLYKDGKQKSIPEESLTWITSGSTSVGREQESGVIQG